MSSEITKTKNQSSKLFYWILFAVFFGVSAIYLLFSTFGDKNLHVYFLDVGQGDSTYVRTVNNHDILIDGGPDSSILSELGEVMPLWDNKIETIILTHPHADHVVGLIEVIKRYKVDEIITTNETHTSNEYIEFLNQIKINNISLKIVELNSVKEIDANTKIEFIWPDENYKTSSNDNLNNSSIVGKLSFDKFNLLLTGDIEIDAENLILENNKSKLENINVLKVPHHGSKNVLENFISEINPDVAVISVGQKNKFGHPSKNILELLTKMKTKIFRTDNNGRIEIISNGKYFWTKAE